VEVVKMPALRQIVLLPVGCLLLLGGALAPANGAAATPPETVVVHDGRTSAPVVDISQVRLDASWYWDSEQSVRVTVPNGFQPGHRLTVWFDLNGDSTPDGHFVLKLSKPKHPGGKSLQKAQEFRLGGGWDGAGKRVRCTGSEDGAPVAGQVRRGQRSVGVYLDLWSCLQVPSPAGTASGSWRAAVSVAKGKNVDMAPNHRGWSKPVAGWGPCDPGGGQC
jgi:hypothetical protein